MEKSKKVYAPVYADIKCDDPYKNTLVLISLFILGAAAYSLYFVAAYSFGINKSSGFGGAICMLLGMGTITATYSIVSNKR